MSMTQPVNLPAGTDRLISTREAALATGLSTAWFERKRWSGGGPEYIKLPGGAVRYRESALKAWFDAHVRTSTSEQSASR